MPSLTMCEGTGCPMRDACYRYASTPSQYNQSYFTEIPYNEESGECEYKLDGWDEGCGHDKNENYHDN
jgi:hypothetical protein